MSDCDLTSLPHPDGNPSVAVLDFREGEGVTAGIGETLADYCREAIQQSGGYILVDRASIKAVLSEQDFSASMKCDETRCLVNFGKKLRAQKIVHGRVSKLGGSYVLAVKMVDVGSAEIEAIENRRVHGQIDDLIDFVAPITCQMLSKALVGK